MLELIVLIPLCRHIGEMCAARNRSAAWIALGPLFWLGGEFAAGFACALAGIKGLQVYLIALAAAMVGALICVLIVSRLSRLEPTGLAGYKLRAPRP